MTARWAIILGCATAAGAGPDVDLDAVRVECRELYTQGRYKEVAALIAGSKQARRDPELQVIFATTKLKMGSVQAARQAYEKLLKRHANQWVAAINLGVIYYRQKIYPRAMLQFLAAAKVRPHSELVLDNLAETYRAYRLSNPPNRPSRRIQQAINQIERLESEHAERKKQQGLVRWGLEWVTPQQRKELERLRIEGMQEIDRLERRLDYARLDLARAKRDVRRYKGLLASGFLSDRLTGDNYRDLLKQAQEDVRTYEQHDRETTRKLENLRGQVPSPTYYDECQLIEIEEDWSLLSPKPMREQPNSTK